MMDKMKEEREEEKICCMAVIPELLGDYTDVGIESYI